jgi:hypothetical protein
MTVKTTSQSWFARQGSPEVFITYRTHGHGRMFQRKRRHAWPLTGVAFCGGSLHTRPTIHLVLTRALALLALLVSTLGTASQAVALTPRVAVCGRVTSFVDVPAPGNDVVRLGTQEPRHLSLGSGVPQTGQEICIWGTDVENVNPPVPDPAPKGIVDYRIAPVASIGCADPVTTTTASFVMPGEANSALPNGATLVLPLSAPAAGGCVRIAVDAQGNPVAVVVPRAATASPAASTPMPRPSVAALPGTSMTDDRGTLALSCLAAGAFVAAMALLARRRSRRAIPS